MAGQEVPSPPSDGATCSHFPSLSDNMEKFVSLIKRGDCTVESACSQVGVARSTFYRWMHRARDPDAPEEFKIFLAAVDSEKEARRVARNQLSSAPTAGKLSTGTLATICQFLEEGCYTIESACAAAGVGRTSLYRWLEQSRDPSAPQKFKQLAQAVEAARLSVCPTPYTPHIFVTVLSHSVTLLRSLVLTVVLSARNPALLVVHYNPTTCTQAVIPLLSNSWKRLWHQLHGA